MAAAYGPTGDVIPPCGKCRQIFFDLDPTIACVVREANGLTALPVSTRLPHAFDWRAADAQRDGFADLARLHTALDQHYPGLGDDAPVDVVEFALTRDSAGAHRR
ncbi:hypothetical protein HQ32_03493 [Prauserella sp. Am3]|nr:hypothetical protein HQ32_03493 [Prauserella sp. Am3]